MVSPCRTTSAHSRTTSPLDRAWKPGFSPVFSALETFVIIALYKLTFTIPYHSHRRARFQIAVATLSGNSCRQTVRTHYAKLVSALLRVAGVTAGLTESNGSLLPGLWLTSPAGWLPRTGISFGTLRSVIEYWLPLPFYYFTLSSCDVPLSDPVFCHCTVALQNFCAHAFLVTYICSLMFILVYSLKGIFFSVCLLLICFINLFL